MCYFSKVIIFGGPWSKKTSWMANEMRDAGVETSVKGLRHVDHLVLFRPRHGVRCCC